MKAWLRVCGTAALLAGVAVLLALWRAPTVWKLATQSLAYGDWAGFCEMAVPGPFAYPGGALRHLATILSLSGASSWSPIFVGVGVFCAALALAALLPELRKGAGLAGLSLPLFALAAPLCLAGTSIWTLTDSALGWRNLLGLLVVAALIRVLRAFHSWLLLVVATLVVSLGPVPFGLYIPLGVTLCLLSCIRGASPRNVNDAQSGRGRPDYIVRIISIALAWAIYLAETTIFYADCSWTNGLLEGSGIIAHLSLSPVTVANLLIFLALSIFAVALKRRDAASPFVASSGEAASCRFNLRQFNTDWFLCGLTSLGILVFGVVQFRQRDVQVQLAAERAAAKGDWKGVLEVVRGDTSALQMVTAWRLLALQRTGEDVLAHLFDEPILANPMTSHAQEFEMDGYELLFGWGLLNATRCWVYQQTPTKGWHARHFEVLGERALIAGEWDLAYRKYAQLARVPFFSAKAENRLAFMAAHQPGEVPEDLVSITQDARAFERDTLRQGSPFFGLNLETEPLVIDTLLRLRNCPKRLLPTVMAAALLAKRSDRLRRDGAVFRHLYTPQTVPLCVREAMDVVSNTTSPQREAFRREMAQVKSDSEIETLAAKWGRSYYFYAECVK